MNAALQGFATFTKNVCKCWEWNVRWGSRLSFIESPPGSCNWILERRSSFEKPFPPLVSDNGYSDMF